MHYLLAMHLEGGPYQGMYLCQLMHLALMALVVLAAWAFARRIASSSGAAVVAAISVAIVPWVTQLASIAYNEGGFLLYRRCRRLGDARDPRAGRPVRSSSSPASWPDSPAVRS